MKVDTLLRSLLPFIVLFTAVSAVAQERPAQRDFIIEGARIEIGDGRVIERGRVVIRDGRITAVGANVDAPAGAEVVNAKGMTLYPGFIDGYTNRGLKLPDPPDAPAERDSRTTAPSTMWPENRKGIRPDVYAAKSLEIKEIASSAHGQGFTAALLAPGGGSIRGVATIAAFLPEAAEENLLDLAFAHSMAFRAGTGAGYPGSLMGIIALLRQSLHDAATYGERRRLNAGEDGQDEGWEALQAALQGRMPVVCHADSEREIGRALDLADEFNLKMLIASGREAYKLADLLKQRDTSVLVSVAIGSEPPLEARESQTDAAPLAVLQERHTVWKERAQNAMRLHEAGVRFGFSSDGDTLGNFLVNVRRVIAQGLPREIALQAMTKNNAQILGLDDLGTIEIGKRAHLVLMDGDFAGDKAAVQMVIVDGQRFQIAKQGESK